MTDPSPTPRAPHAQRGTPSPTPLRRLRSVAASLLGAFAVLATFLAPASLALRSTIADPAAFAAVTVPVLHEEELRVLIADVVAEQVAGSAPVEAVRAWAQERGTGEIGAAALARARVELTTLVHDGVEAVLSRDDVGRAWETAVRVLHAQAVASLTGDDRALVRLRAGTPETDEGSRLVLDLTAVQEQVRVRLQEHGVPSAVLGRREVVIDLGDGAALAQAQEVTGVAVRATGLTVAAAVVLTAATLVVARSRARALAGWGVGVAALGAVLVLVLREVSGRVAGTSGSASVILESLLARATSPIEAAVGAVALVGVVVAIVGVVLGRLARGSRRGSDAAGGAHG